MTKDKIIEYHLKNQQLKYQADKEKYKAIRDIVIAFLGCVSLVSCFWIYLTN